MEKRCKRIDINNIDAKTLNGYSDYYRGEKRLVCRITNANTWYRVAEVGTSAASDSNIIFIIALSAFTSGVSDSSTYVVNHAYYSSRFNRIGTGGYINNYCSLRVVNLAYAKIAIEIKVPMQNTDINISFLGLVANVSLHTTPEIIPDNPADGNVEATVTGSASISANSLLNSSLNNEDMQLTDNQLQKSGGGNFRISTSRFSLCRKSATERRAA